MRILISVLAATLLAAPLAPRAAAKDVSVEFFYETLDPYGDWIQTADYGYVWHPKDAAEDWRPYTVGSWAYTDAGWTWVSEEPYGAITYHYGRWTRLQDAGWVWVPDTEWAPAWVSWRRSDQYLGWAPLPPEATFKRDVGISSWADSYYDIGPTQYSFVAVRDFGQPRLATVILPRQKNVTIIGNTRNITNISYSERGIYNDGPQYDVVVRESREPVRRLRLERRDDVVFEGNRVRGDGMRATVVGDSLRVFAPAVAFSPSFAPTRVARHVEHVEVDRGWQGVPQAQELRVHIQGDTHAPAGLPKQPAFTRASVSLGLGNTTDRGTRNLDAEGKPRVSTENHTPRDGVAGERLRNPATTVAPDGTATDRPRTADEKPMKPGEKNPGNRKPATAEVKPFVQPEGRPPTPATTAERPGDRPPGIVRTPREAAEAPAPDAPRAGRGGPPPAAANPEAAREIDKPGKAMRPPGAPEAPRGPKELRPDAERPGKEPKVAVPAGDAPRLRKEGAPEAPRRPDAAPAGDAPRLRKESAPEAPHRPDAAPANRPPGAGAPGATPAPEGKGKKGDKDKDKDKKD